MLARQLRAVQPARHETRPGDDTVLDPAKAIDGNNATFAHSETRGEADGCYRGELAPDTWLRIDLGVQAAVTRIEVLDRQDLAVDDRGSYTNGIMRCECGEFSGCRSGCRSCIATYAPHGV